LTLDGLRVCGLWMDLFTDYGWTLDGLRVCGQEHSIISDVARPKFLGGQDVWL